MAEIRRYALIPQDTAFSKALNKLPLSARWLYIVLAAKRRGRDISFSLSYTKIKEITGFAPATTRRAIKALVEAELLVYEHGGLEQNPNIYYLEPGWLKIVEGK
jgi:hypothetical protein